MILVTVGMNEQPFDRLVRLGGALGATHDVLVQHGSSRVRDGRARHVGFLDHAELQALMREADAVVAHAGVGTVMLARACGRVPIVVPRRHALGEAVDDHQVLLCRRLADRGAVLGADDEREVRAALPTAAAVPVLATGDGTTPRLAAAVLGELRDLLAC